MRNLIAVLFVLLLTSTSTHCHAAQRQLVDGNWTGGFWLNANWVAVDINLKAEKEDLAGTANIVFPSYSNTLSERNVNLVSLKWDSPKIEFDVPFEGEKIAFHGLVQGETISGRFEYEQAKGTFGLNRVVYSSPELLEKYYGIYRAGPDRFISVFRGWNDARTLEYVDYKTAQAGTLWASTRENEFFSGAGRRVSFPVALKVSFDKDAGGNVKSLLWQSLDEPNVTAQKIEVKEERITFKNGDITLGSTLIWPATKGRHAVVIVTPGDFGTNRNQLRMWAHNYVSRGVAALVFDSRGAGESTGIINVNSFSDLANDVLAIVQSLKTREDINPKQIGLFGFSNSAWTVTLAASRSNDVAFLILQSFSGVQPWKQEIFRAETQLRVDKFPESTVRQGVDFMRLKFEAARTGAGWEQIQKIMTQATGERWLAYTNPPRSLEGLQQNWQRSYTYNPVPALEKLKIPVLAYWGGKDTYVPAQESIAAFKQAMAKADNRNYVVKVYLNGRHDLVEGESGSPSISSRLKKFPGGFWKMQADWLLKHVDLLR